MHFCDDPILRHQKTPNGAQISGRIQSRPKPQTTSSRSSSPVNGSKRRDRPAAGEARRRKKRRREPASVRCSNDSREQSREPARRTANPRSYRRPAGRSRVAFGSAGQPAACASFTELISRLPRDHRRERGPGPEGAGAGEARGGIESPAAAAAAREGGAGDAAMQTGRGGGKG